MKQKSERASTITPTSKNYKDEIMKLDLLRSHHVLSRMFLGYLTSPLSFCLSPPAIGPSKCSKTAKTGFFSRQSGVAAVLQQIQILHFVAYFSFALRLMSLAFIHHLHLELTSILPLDTLHKSTQNISKAPHA